MNKHEKHNGVSSKSSGVLSSIRWSIAYIIAIPVIVCVIMIWISHQRISDFENGQHDVAKSTVTLVGKEVSALINNYQRLVSIFTRNEQKLITQLAQVPSDDRLKAQLKQRLHEYFPDYFTFTLADHDGNPVIDDFDGFIGEVCLRDIKQVAKGETQYIHVHPNPNAYHIDIMTQWGNEEKGGIFFVSFHTDFLSKLLKLSSPYRHELMLVSTQFENLIEVTEKGERFVLKRDDFRLTEEEQERILYSTPVTKANWKLVDFRERALFSDFRTDMIVFSAIIILLFIAGSVIMILLLMRSEKRRLAAVRVKEEMFSLFNHDLRSPLNSIYATLKLFVTRPVANEQEDFKKLSGLAFGNAQTMLGLVNDILDIQKMELGGMEFEFSKNGIVSLVQDTIDMNTQYGEMHNVSFKLLKPEHELYINADRKRLQQALTNLLSNAIKYSPDNEAVTVCITSKNGYVRISVSDNGPGISSDFQHMVFDKFAQSKSMLTKSIGGTGLGLTIVKYIIDSHHGRVFFDTETGVGTTFHVELRMG